MPTTSSGKNLTHAHVKGNRWLFRTEAQHLAAAQDAKRADADELAEKSRAIGRWLKEGHRITRLPPAFARFD